MRFLLENEDGKDVSKFIGIALGIAGGVLILTGILWFLYHRFGDLWGSLTGIPPERKTLVFTDLGRLQDATKKDKSRSASTRPFSRSGRPTTVSAPQPPPTPTSLHSPRGSRVTTARFSTVLLPALSVGLEADALPSTPGSISSPRGYGRALFNTIDRGLRSSNTGCAAASGDESRPTSATTQQHQQHQHMLPSGSFGGTLDCSLTALGAERPGSGGTGTRPSSGGSTATRTRGSAATSAAAAPAVAVAASGVALPPALVPTGSITAWKGPLISSSGQERALRSLAAGTTTSPVETLDTAHTSSGAGAGGRGATGTAGGAVSGFGTGAGAVGRPPLPLPPPLYRSSASGASGPVLAVALTTTGSLVGPSDGANFVRHRVARSRPSSGNGPSAATGEGSSAGGSAGGSPIPDATWQRLGGANVGGGSGGVIGVRNPRMSHGAGRMSGQLADDAASYVSRSSSQFTSFTHHGAPEDPAGGQQTQTHQHSLGHSQQHQQTTAPSSPLQAQACGSAAVRSSQDRTRWGCSEDGIQDARTAAAAETVYSEEYGNGHDDAVAESPSAPTATAAGAAAASVAMMVSRAAVVDPFRPKDGTTVAAPEITAVEAEVEADGDGSVHRRGRRQVVLELQPASTASAAVVVAAGASAAAASDGSPRHTSPTQTAWAAAVSLSSKLFSRGSRTDKPATTP